MKTLFVDLKSKEYPAILAQRELVKYITQMDPGVSVAYGQGGITLAVAPEEFAVADPALDDAVSIKVSGGKGRIAASNARALLIGVYLFFRKLGASFLKPGKNGEMIPSRLLEEMTVSYSHAASYRHRGICIEGAVSIEHVLDMLEWMPKAGYNSYFVQFLTPFHFFQRYYGHEWHIYKQPERLTKTIIDGFTVQIMKAAKERGLMYHAAGHGWTCEPLGVPGLGWYLDENEYPQEVTKLFAEVNGKRELWGKIPLNTNLCYGNEITREKITSTIANYCEAHPEVDVLQFWLADGSNNHCECPLCVDTIPADFYVRMLNDLDQKLTEKGLPTRVVFLIYVDLLWKPEKETLQNTDRFILMFAPISRTYSQTLQDDGSGQTRPYVRNKLEFPKNVADGIAYLRDWQGVIGDCDSFIFDYHFMWDYIREAGSMHHAKTLFSDMVGLEKLKLDGMVSCQNQRVFFPTPLGMHAMAEALWDKTVSFGEVADKVLGACFGKAGQTVKEYLQGLSDVYPADVARNESPRLGEDTARRFDEAESYCLAWYPKLKELESRENPCVERCFAVLLLHNEMTRYNAQLYAFNAREDRLGAKTAFAELSRLAAKAEEHYSTEFDLCLYLQTVAGSVGLGRKYTAPPLED